MQAWSRNPTHDPSVIVTEGFCCFRPPRGHCDRHLYKHAEVIELRGSSCKTRSYTAQSCSTKHAQTRPFFCRWPSRILLSRMWQKWITDDSFSSRLMIRGNVISWSVSSRLHQVLPQKPTFSKRDGNMQWREASQHFQTNPYSHKWFADVDGKHFSIIRSKDEGSLPYI
jgi:hypothetical protein